MLLTKYKKAPAEASLSPYLKGILPTSSLDTEHIGQPASVKANIDKDALSSAGLKFQSLNSAADAILKSAKKLVDEVKLETKYWNQVSSVAAKGWAVSRLPRERQTLGVRFGFLESPTEYRDQGLGPLRRSEDGSVDLDLSVNKARPRVLRARVLRNEITIATSSEQRDRMDDDSTEAEILRARNSTFDSELFAEIYREGRSLATRGVRCHNNGVAIPLAIGEIILVELVDQTSSLPQALPGNEFKKQQRLPDIVIVALRILLCHSHRQNYRRRKEKPPSVSDRRAQRVPANLLRPILSFLQHRFAVGSLQHKLDQIQSIFSNAGLDLHLAPFGDKADLEKFTGASNPEESADYIHTLVEKLCGLQQTSIRIEVPSQDSKLTIEVRTHALGTQYKLFRAEAVAVDPTMNLILSEDALYSDKDDVLELLTEVLKIDLTASIQSQSQGKWHTETPFYGELQTAPRNGCYYKLRLLVKPDRLELRWAVVHFLQEQSIFDLKVWDGTEKKEGRPGLLQAIGQMSSAPPDEALNIFA